MEEKTKILYRMAVHAAFLLLAAVGICYFVNEIILEENQWNWNYVIIGAFLCIVILGYSCLKRKQLFYNMRNTLFCMACFLVSALLLLLSDFYVNLPFWLAGGILIAALVDRNLGMLYVYFFAFHAIYLQGNAIGGLVLHFLVATAICFVIPKMKTWLSMLYVMVFSSSLVVVLALIMNRMKFEQNMLLDSFCISGIYAGCILLAMLLRLYMRAGSVEAEFAENVELDVDKLLAPMNSGEEISAAAVKQAEEMALQPVAERTVKETSALSADTTDYKQYCDENAELLRELKEKKKAVYAHSRLVGKMAGEAAAKIGANTGLVCAAGLYHEIGKLREGNAQTVEIAKEQNFPVRLLCVLEECTDNQKFTSRESAVVALTDLILQTYTYLRASGRFATTAKKIVENIVALSITKGGMNDSGMTLADLNALAVYFTEQLSEQDRKKGH